MSQSQMPEPTVQTYERADLSCATVFTQAVPSNTF